MNINNSLSWPNFIHSQVTFHYQSAENSLMISELVKDMGLKEKKEAIVAFHCLIIRCV